MDMRRHIEKLRCIATGLYATANIFEDEHQHNIAAMLNDYSCDIENISVVLEEIDKRENMHEGVECDE